MKTSVCIAMDHGPLREAITSLFRTLGYEVPVSTSKGKDLLIKLRGTNEVPAFCLIDFRIEGENGVATCREIKRLFPSMRVVVYSMDSGRSSIKQMREAGCYRYLFKGCDIDELVDAFVT